MLKTISLTLGALLMIGGMGYYFSSDISEATNLIIENQDETNKQSNNQKESNSQNKQPKEKKNLDQENSKEANSSNQEKSSDDEMTKQKAEATIRQSLRISEDSKYKVEMDHKNNDGDYIFNVYEVVEQEGNSHTATYGWYKVDAENGGVEDLFK
ncbi:hypothetical protein E3U55_14185 [Filobacillus milosensis]|uniref:PepSY domain-containing protein n=1 Tax=Filobacillus milosensis TaxID=94137 RepID=A0A4Y8IGF5_9BACI|nr:hypothetical protein [Filobacillus milosensis]TFB14194.1 hypothetical protein E3U55_14185 [Filobacillus milosensis]